MAHGWWVFFSNFFCAAFEVKFNLHTALDLKINYGNNYNVE